MQAAQQHRFVRIIFTAIIILLFTLMFVPFFTPLLLAGLFAFAFENLVTKYARRFKSRPLVTIALLVLLSLFVATPLVLVSLKTFSTIKEYATIGLQNTEAYKLTETMLTSISEKADAIAQSLDVDLSQLPRLGDGLSRGSQFLAAFATGFIASIPDIILSLLVFLLSLYYFLTESANIKTFFLNLNLLKKNEVTEIIHIIKTSSYLTVIASALVGALQALIVAVFGYFCGYKQFMMIFVLTFISSLIPVIGAAPMALVLAAFSFIQGNNGTGIILIVAAVIAGSIDNVVKPLIVNASSSDDLHPVIALLALIGAIMIYGAPGILLGPILTQLAFKIISILFPGNEALETVANRAP